MQIRKAERKKAKLRLGIAGASGSGKTWGSLEIATGIGGKIGMIDTENRGYLFGDDFNYDIIVLEAPFYIDKYIEAIKTFEKKGYDILIIDSLSHAWEGQGGVLSTVDAGGGWFAKGGQQGNKDHNALIHAIISSKMHVITTLRAKTEYSMAPNDRGKMSLQKLGLKPIQRENIEYEYTVFINMNQEKQGLVSKDNTKLFHGKYLTLTQDIGKELVGWLNNGKEDLSPEQLREQFVTIQMPEIVAKIGDCKDLNALKEIYDGANSDYAKKYPEEFKNIVMAKDAQKIALLEAQVPASIVLSKHSNALTQGASL